MRKKVKEKGKEKRSVFIWVLPVVTYLCFVAELAFIIVGDINYGIIFAGLCFCLVIVFFVLWREEQAHKRLSLQSSLDDALRREEQEKAGKEHEQIRRLRKEKEALASEREQTLMQMKKLAQEKEALTKQFEEAKHRKNSALMRVADECILPPDEKPAELDLVSVAVSVVAQMEDACRRAGIRLRLSCANETFPYLADERYIRLILHHIIDNAVKFVQRRGSLVITLSQLGNNIFWAFKDDGRGLPQEEVDHIFDLNFQGSNRIGGNGMGLAQVKAVVSHYGGTVYARSTDGMGIYIQLPLSRKAADGRACAQEEKMEETACEGNGTDKDHAGGA